MVESLLGVLTRTLRDEYKKSIDLTIYILGTMLALSNFREFHELLLENQIGDATMKVVDYQVKRGTVIAGELKGKLEQCMSSPATSSSGQARGGPGGRTQRTHGSQGGRAGDQEVSRDDQEARQAVLPYLAL